MKTSVNIYSNVPILYAYYIPTPSSISSILSQCDLSHSSYAILTRVSSARQCQWAFSPITLCEQVKSTSDAEAGKEGMRDPPQKGDAAQLAPEGCCWAQGGLCSDGSPVAASKHPIAGVPPSEQCHWPASLSCAGLPLPLVASLSNY